MTTWKRINSVLAAVVFGLQALLGLLAAGWLVVHRLPAGDTGMSIVWVLMSPVPLLWWMVRPRHSAGGSSLRRMCGWAAVMVVVLLLQVPLTKSFLATVPLVEVIGGVLIIVSEFLRFAVDVELDADVDEHRGGQAGGAPVPIRISSDTGLGAQLEAAGIGHVVPLGGGAGTILDPLVVLPGSGRCPLGDVEGNR